MPKTVYSNPRYQPTKAQAEVLKEMAAGGTLWKNFGPHGLSYTWILSMTKSTKKLKIETVQRLYQHGFIDYSFDGTRAFLTSKGREFVELGVSTPFAHILK